jgi:hypothetical protein
MITSMKNFILLIPFLGVHVLSLAEAGPKNTPVNKPVAIEKAAGCAYSKSSLVMDYNDVRCILEPAGLLWLRRGDNKPVYQVPKGLTTGAKAPSSIYAGSLWMGGIDVNGNLKLAAEKFRQFGTDFTTGPLSITPGSGNYDVGNVVGNGAIKEFGAATITADECLKWDRFFTVKKADVVLFKVWWDYSNGFSDVQVDAPSADALNSITNWPGNGDAAQFQDFYMAPYYNNTQLSSNIDYNPLDEGDYPWFDDILGKDDIKCKADRRVSLFGDITNWFVFNDKGATHTNSSGAEIGVEVRGQAFCFATSDEINRMTFYNYEIINRGTQTLTKTYFSQYADSDVGLSSDDLVGCDVSRGLGFMFNAVENDLGADGAAYGASPPAIGFDFFEGPYQDADLKDNPGPVTDASGVTIPVAYADAIANKGIVYKGIGVGYGDGVVDNERYGMRNFKYFINAGAQAVADPVVSQQYYNLMSGKWNTGVDVTYGALGLDPNAIKTDFTYFEDSDPLGWATGGLPQADWYCNTSYPTGKDFRIVQTAGPFTLRPGAVNNLTVGLVYGRSANGTRASVAAMKVADTRAQALFDNCFRIVEPPEAPLLKIQELNKELILTISNPNPAALNYRERYKFLDFNITSLTGDKFYRFEGYQIFQLADAESSVADIEDVDKVRLVGQCDIKNDVQGKIVNYDRDEALGADIPKLKVASENSGIRHSFQIKTDAFAKGDNKNLVNHKTYYFVAVAYGYNNYKKFDPTDAAFLDGQKKPYIISRQSQFGGKISSVAAIPHIVNPEAAGTVQNTVYGSGPEITRLDGSGNSNAATELTDASINEILANGKADRITYKQGKGPIGVKVIDPLNVADGYFELKSRGSISLANFSSKVDNSSDRFRWSILRYASEGGALLDSIVSDSTFKIRNEQLIPQWGLSVNITNDPYTNVFANSVISLVDEMNIPTLISSSISFADSSKKWLNWIPDGDGATPQNYIANGNKDIPDPLVCDNFNSPTDPCTYYIRNGINGTDPESKFTKLDGGLVPFFLSNVGSPGLPVIVPDALTGTGAASGIGAVDKVRDFLQKPQFSGAGSILAGTLSDVDLVMTNDKSKWTRCPVLELGWDENFNQNGGKKGLLRNAPSVNKDGLPDGSGNGYGWFPGYAIDVNTGQRLFMVFGENSSQALENGADMLWNPSSAVFQGAGMHAVYISGTSANVALLSGTSVVKNIPTYTDNAESYFSTMLSTTSMSTDQAKTFYTSMHWMLYPYLNQGQKVLSTDVKITARVNKKYRNYTATGLNGGRPMYSWNTKNLLATKGDAATLVDALDLINVVPNPYYAYSEYERSRIDSRVKIVNLPVKCTIKIYNVSGKLIRTFKKDSEITSQDWDLQNFTGVPIASGVYLIHVEAPGAGEKVVKFFCGMRQIDLQNI